MNTNQKQNVSISEQENIDVAWLMSFAADRDTVDPWTAKRLKRASRLLRETTGCCHAALQELKRMRNSGDERLLRSIFGEESQSDAED